MYQAAQARMYYCLYNNGTKRESMPVCTPFEIPCGSPAQEYILDTDIQDILRVTQRYQMPGLKGLIFSLAYLLKLLIIKFSVLVGLSIKKGLIF